MKTNQSTLKVLAAFLLIFAGMTAMAQTNDSPTQEVCPGTEPYLINPGNPNNTFLWSIGSGTSGTDWTIESPTTAATNIIWGPTTTPQTYTVTFREVDPVSGCYDEVTLQVTVNPEPLAPTGDPITVCETNPIQAITAVATAPAGATIVWYDAPTGGNIVADPTWSAVGTVTYYAESVMGTCNSSTRTPITLTIEPAPLAPTGDAITACETNPIQSITALATAPNGATVVWYDAPTEGNVVADPTLSTVGTVTYYAESQLGTCVSATRTPIVLTITPAPLAPTGEAITACETNPIQSITALATAPDGATIVWYDAPTEGNIVVDPTLSAVGTVTYYAESQIGGCISATRTPVVLTITPAPEAPTGLDITVCEQNPVQTITASATAPAGATVVWYTEATGGTVVADPTLSTVGTVTYYAESQIGGCVSATRTPITLTIEPAPLPTINGPDAMCALTQGNVYNTEAGMTNYTWLVSAGGTITAGGGTGDNTITVTWNTQGPQTISVNYESPNGCSATTPTVRNITVSPIPNTSPIFHN